MVEKAAEAPVGAVPEDANQRKCTSCGFYLFAMITVVNSPCPWPS